MFAVQQSAECSFACLHSCSRGLAVEDFPLLLLSIGEYIAVRRGLSGLSQADALAGKRAEVSRLQHIRPVAAGSQGMHSAAHVASCLYQHTTSLVMAYASTGCILGSVSADFGAGRQGMPTASHMAACSQHTTGMVMAASAVC